MENPNFNQMEKNDKENYKDKKFIHLYSLHISDKAFYPHIFKHGINIKPHLAEFSYIGGEDYNHADRLIHLTTEAHQLFAKQLNKVLKDESLNNGDVVEFSLEI